MANNATNTNISYDAKLWWLPEGVTAPTAVDETVAAGALYLGYLDEGGETLSVSQTLETYKAHQSRAPIRNGITEATTTFAPTLIEDTPEVRELFHGVAANAPGVTVTDGTKTITGTFVYDTIDDQAGYEKMIRFVFKATVTANGDLTFAPGEMVTYPLLMTILGDLTRMDEIVSGS